MAGNLLIVRVFPESIYKHNCSGLLPFWKKNNILLSIKASSFSRGWFLLFVIVFKAMQLLWECWSWVDTYQNIRGKIIFFVILTILMTFEQTKSWTTTNLCYFSWQKMYFRWIFCGTQKRFFNVFRNVLSSTRRKCIHSVSLAVFFKIESYWT